MNGVSKKANKKCRNSQVLIVVQENCKIFKIKRILIFHWQQNFYSDKAPSISGMLDMANSIQPFAILSHPIQILTLPAQKKWLITLQVRIHINKYLLINSGRSASLRIRIPTVKLKIPEKLFLKSDPKLPLHSKRLFYFSHFFSWSRTRWVPTAATDR